MRNTTLLIFFFLSLNVCAQESAWEVVVHFPDREEEIVAIPQKRSVSFRFEKVVDGAKVSVNVSPSKDYDVFRVEVSPTDRNKRCFVSLKRSYSTGTPFNFNGPVLADEIYRQSPHDNDAWIVTSIAEQAVPVVALKVEHGFEVAVCGSPYLYENFTSQAFLSSPKRISLRSGDDGEMPGIQLMAKEALSLDYNGDKNQRFSPGKVLSYYHDIRPGKPHVFEGIFFTSKSTELKGLRADINRNVADHFSGGKFRDYFGALSYTTAYLNLRTNETGKSKVWVVPAVEYANTQYGRDAFWISMMLDPHLSAECLANELASVNHFAEYPLYTILWSYRLYLQNISLDKNKVQAYVDAVEQRVKGGRYYSFHPGDGRLDFQYWGDLMAFDSADVITYNQGLLAVALRAAEQMGLKTETSWLDAKIQYRNLFNDSLGIYPVSKMKSHIMSPDPIVGDLLSMLLFDDALLSDETVRSHFKMITTKARTDFGFKVVSGSDGNYLKDSDYDVQGYISQMNKERLTNGTYFRGGSYFLYDNLLLIDALLHGIKDAEGFLRWRTKLDFVIGNTTYETINTVTGEPWKPNMGWNVAIYAICRQLVDRGKLSRRMFDEIDKASRPRKN